MAQSKYREYSGGRVAGNLAYSREYEDFEPQRRQREQKNDSGSIPQRQSRGKVRRRPKVALRKRQKVSAVLVAGSGLIILMLVMLVMNYVHLNAVSSNIVALQKQVDKLQEEYGTLLTGYEQTYDAAFVKEAAAAFNMSKPSSSQIYYIDLSKPSSVEVHAESDHNVLNRIFSSFGQGVGIVLEYFS